MGLIRFSQMLSLVTSKKMVNVLYTVDQNSFQQLILKFLLQKKLLPICAKSIPFIFYHLVNAHGGRHLQFHQQNGGGIRKPHRSKDWQWPRLRLSASMYQSNKVASRSFHYPWPFKGFTVNSKIILFTIASCPKVSSSSVILFTS